MDLEDEDAKDENCQVGKEFVGMRGMRILERHESREEEEKEGGGGGGEEEEEVREMKCIVSVGESTLLL